MARTHLLALLVASACATNSSSGPDYSGPSGDDSMDAGSGDTTGGGARAQATLRLFQERDKLAAFKDYCHARLDAAGVPTDPDSPHKAEGCRIGGRLDYVFARVKELERKYAAGDNIGDGHIKQELAEAINAMLEPMRARRAEYEKPGGDDAVIDIIKDGTRRANVIAEETLHLAKKAMKLDFGARVLR